MAFRILLIALIFPALLSAAQPNLLLITIDTIRADHLGCYGNSTIKTPVLDSIANKSLFFENAICAAPLTLPSHTSLMTGRYPIHHGTRDNAGRVRDQEQTLAETLKAHGYNTYAFVSGFPLDHRFGLNQGFDVYNDEFQRDEGRPLDFGSERNAEAVVNAFLKVPKKPPFFAWIHFYDPHAPYLNGGYNGEIEFVDKQLGRLIAKINLSDTFVAVAGDHGEGLGEHKEFTHRIFLYDTTMHVPFFISGPGINPQKISAQVRLVDFVPTILNKMKIESPKNLDGVILTAGTGNPALLESMFPQLQLGWSALRGVRTADWKFIDCPKPELFDLQADPKELHNVYSQHADIVKKLRAQLPKNAPLQTQEISPEMQEQLASLGYVGGNNANANGPDPKDRIAVWNLIEQAHDLETKDRKKSISLLENARKSDPSNPMVLNFLAELYTDESSYPQAKTILGQILQGDPKNVPALLRIARLSLKTGKPQDALKYADQIKKLGENNAETELLMASAYLDQQNFKTAALHLQKSLEIDPDDDATRIDLGNLYLQLNEGQKARTQFDSVLKRNPKNVQALNGVATCLFNSKNLQQSEEYLRKALLINGHDPQTQMNLALIFSEQGKKDQAIEIYRGLENSNSVPQEWRDMARSRRVELEQ
jgi:tetratricopeptide (TPR) repeat protein